MWGHAPICVLGPPRLGGCVGLAGGCAVALGPQCQAGPPGTPWPSLAHPPNVQTTLPTVVPTQRQARRSRPCPRCIANLHQGRRSHVAQEALVQSHRHIWAQTHVDNRTATTHDLESQRSRGERQRHRAGQGTRHTGRRLLSACQCSFGRSWGGGRTSEVEAKPRQIAAKGPAQGRTGGRAWSVVPLGPRGFRGRLFGQVPPGDPRPSSHAPCWASP